MGERMMNRSIVLGMGGLIFILMLTAASLPAQQYQDPGEELANNYRELRAYSWSMRTAVSLGGQQARVAVDKMRYDLDGNLQVTPLGGSGQLTPEQQRLVDKLATLALSYAQPNPQKFSAFMAAAEQWDGRGPNAGVTKIEGNGLLQQDDSVEILLRNDRMDKGRADTYMEGSLVKLDAEYRLLPGNGPRYVARLIARVPTEKLEVSIENFDYIRNAPVAAGDVTTVPEGTELLIRLLEPLSSDKSQAGQAFEGTVDSDIRVQGRTIIARGSSIKGVVVEAVGSGRVSGRAKMSLKLTQVQAAARNFEIETNTLAMEAEGTTKRDAGRIGGAAAIGAVIGAIAGGGSGAATGAAIGGGVGVGGTVLTKGKEVTLDVETLLSFKLLKPVQIFR
jgi:hypothetical protein